MTTIRSIVAQMKVGVAATLVALAIGVVSQMVWGPLFGRYGWDIIAAGIMIFAAVGIAMLEEFARPQNPYRHLDPRFSYLDAAPTGSMASGGSGWLWNAAPLVFVAVLIGLAHLLG
ncbi:MAG TPA: hypothetical protein PLR44_09080 [Thermomicrobiales bacterium]|jgi:hypothetical protein|nr:hypothetical protein [Chloroflexota bacterium]HBY45437.1 hypothetical protein [Chloroflexota bacterium]HCG28988.1 hypothetical protein [Chloroflexota bacterium]HQZ90191.1 hypothetical protein [Thermomicrobiales bacterium]HRA30716.1 hypothetical protein [Thermomicrobiales bacterium]